MDALHAGECSLPPGYLVSADVPIQHYYSDAHGLLLQSQAAVATPRTQYALLMRLVTLLHERLPAHPAYARPAHAAWRRGAEAHVRAALDTLERLRPDVELEVRAAQLGLRAVVEEPEEPAVMTSVAAAPQPAALQQTPSYPTLSALLGGGPAAMVPVSMPTMPTAPRPAAAPALRPRARVLRLPRTAAAQFDALVAPNTRRDTETCGVLCGDGHLRVTHVVVPPQTGARDQCAMTDAGEAALLDYQLEHDLMTLGWIHTHPSFGCFLSSIDMHTHAGYQVMLPEAVAVVLSPREGVGVFSLSPAGLELLLRCPRRGFHQHPEPGLYGRAAALEVVEAPVQVVDLRK